MARIIKPPMEWQVDCPYCDATIGYTRVDVTEYERSDPIVLAAKIQCPQCEYSIVIPRDKTARKEVQS